MNVSLAVFILISMIQLPILRSFVYQLRISQLDQLRAVYEWHLDIQQKTYMLFRKIGKDIREDVA